MMNQTPMMNLTKQSRKRRPRERGIAMIIVLATVALFFVLATMCMTSGRASRLNGKIHSSRAAARYAAESTTAHVQWMILSDRLDRRNAAAGRLGRNALGTAPAEDEEVSLWQADGNPLTLELDELTTVTFRILDANRGHDVTGRQPGRKLRRDLGLNLESSADEVAEVETFLDSLDDYVDNDEFVRLHGHEQADYERLGHPGLPRNRPLLYAEEAYWIPGIQDFAPQLGGSSGDFRPVPEDLLRIVPPIGRNFPAKPAFFSSSPQMVQSLAGLTEEEMLLVEDAKQQWYQNRVPIRESLGELYQPIAEHLSFDESGVFTIDVTATTNNGTLSRTVSTTVELPNLPRANPLEPFLIWRRTIR